LTVRRAAVVLVLAGLTLGLAVMFAAPAGAAGESINARLLDNSGKETVPVPGVQITVRQDGAVIGEAVSDDAGLAVVPVPGPGDYEVRIDPKTIPKGFALSDPSQVRLPAVTVQEGQPQFVIFPFGEAGEEEPGAIDRLADLFGSGLRVGLLIAVAAVALSLVYGTTGLINFAHGELVTFGGVVAWFLNAGGSDGLGITLVIAGIVAVLLGGAFGGALELGLWRRLRQRRTGNVALLVVSIGLALFLRSVFQLVFGSSPHSYAQYAVQRAESFGPLDILPKNLAIIGICAGILVLVALLLTRTRLGTAVRAVTDSSDLAESSGIDVQRVILVAWVACGALAAAAGVLLGMSQQVDYDMGFKLLLLIFAAMILGGLGSPWGAMIGGIVLGIGLEVSTYWIPTDFRNALALGILILVLLVRPQGILGVKERVS